MFWAYAPLRGFYADILSFERSCKGSYRDRVSSLGLVAGAEIKLLEMDGD